MKKEAMLLLVIAMMISVFIMTSCSQDDKDREALSLTIVMSGQSVNNSLGDSVMEGAMRLNSDYGVGVNTVECRPETFKENIRMATRQSDVLVLVGGEFTDVGEVANAYPGTKFIWLDNSLKQIADYENVLCITYAQNEGAFLAGYVAAKMTETGVIGVVGGEKNAGSEDYILGYEQGAKHANQSVNVLKAYAKTYSDAAKVKACALTLNNQGADIIFQVAGDAGRGVFEAAWEKDFYAIGVEVDQKLTMPEFDEQIICSVKKDYGQSIYDVVKAMIEDGTWCGGTIWTADMSSGYLSIAYGDEASEQIVSARLKSEVEMMSSKIISGEIKVNTAR